MGARLDETLTEESSRAIETIVRNYRDAFEARNRAIKDKDSKEHIMALTKRMIGYSMSYKEITGNNI